MREPLPCWTQHRSTWNKGASVGGYEELKDVSQAKNEKGLYLRHSNLCELDPDVTSRLYDVIISETRQTDFCLTCAVMWQHPIGCWLIQDAF